MNEFFDAMVDNLDEGLFLGDPPREVSSDGLGSIKVQYTTLESAVSTSSRPGASTFGPGQSLKDRFKGTRECGQGTTCSGVVAAFTEYDDNLITENENERDHDVDVDGSKVWCPCFLLGTKERKKDTSIVQGRVCSLGITRFTSLGSWMVHQRS